MSGAVLLLLAAIGVAVARHSLGFLRFRARVRASLDATPDIRWQRWTRRGLAITVSGYALELLENLRARTRHLLEEIAGPRREYVALDEYDAARLLVADLLVPPDVPDPVFAIPHEHACLVAPADRPGELREAAVKAFRSAPLPLTSALYQWTGMRPQKVEGQ